MGEDTVPNNPRERKTARMLKLFQDGLPGGWRSLLAGLESPPEEIATFYHLAHVQGALDDLAHAISLAGSEASPGAAQELKEYETKLDDLAKAEKSRLQQLGDLELQDMLRNYAIYISGLDDLLDPGLRQGEVYSIVSVRNEIESLVRLPISIRPSGARVAEVLRLDEKLREFIGRVPWSEWVGEDVGHGEYTEWYVNRFWWWGRLPERSDRSLFP